MKGLSFVGEAPQRDGRRELGGLIVGVAEEVAEAFEGSSAYGDVVNVAAGLAHGVPNLVEVIGFASGIAECGGAIAVHGASRFKVTSVGAVEVEPIGGGAAVRKSPGIAERRSVFQFLMAAAQDGQISGELLEVQEPLFARVEQFPLD